MTRTVVYPAAEHFGLMLTALRNTGVDIPLHDKAVADLFVNALEDAVGNFGTRQVDETAENIALELRCLLEAEAFVSDNGTSGED